MEWTDSDAASVGEPRDAEFQLSLGEYVARWWQSVDRVSLIALIWLVFVGILLSYASSPVLALKNGQGTYHYIIRHVVFLSLALAAMLAISCLSLKATRRFGVLLFVLSFVAIILLPIFGTDYGKGAIRWYSLGFAGLQPSEFLKPGFAVFGAWLIAASADLGGPPGRRITFLAMLISVAFLANQPDYGQSILLIAIWVALYFLAGGALWVMGMIGGSVLLLGFILYQLDPTHFAHRIDSFLSPDVGPRTQLAYAISAIQEGGFFGVGLGNGVVKENLPDAHTDFIIAVAAEEFGLGLVFTLILAYLAIGVSSFYRLIHERNLFVKIAGGTLVSILMLQAAINMGVAVRLLPPKGMTLPFISYGGSSMLAVGITMGMILALTRRRPQYEMSELFGIKRMEAGV